MILSFWLCTEVQKVTLHHLLSSRVSPTRFLSALRGCAQRPPKSDQICSLFSNMAQFPGRVKILKQYLLSEMDTVENNIFTLNI